MRFSEKLGGYTVPCLTVSIRSSAKTLWLVIGLNPSTTSCASRKDTTNSSSKTEIGGWNSSPPRADWIGSSRQLRVQARNSSLKARGSACESAPTLNAAFFSTTPPAPAVVAGVRWPRAAIATKSRHFPSAIQAIQQDAARTESPLWRPFGYFTYFGVSPLAHGS